MANDTELFSFWKFPFMNMSFQYIVQQRWCPGKYRLNYSIKQWFQTQRPDSERCSGSYSVAVTNSMMENNLEEERIYVLSSHSPWLREAAAGAQARRWRQILKRRPRRSAAPWLARYGFLGLLSYTTQDHLSRCGTSCRELSPPTPITNWENAYRPTGRRQFLYWGSYKLT